MNKKSIINPFVGIVLCLVLTGCATPKAARDLAKVTSINASLVETKIINFNKSSEEIYKGRAEAAEKLSQVIERSRTELDAYLESATSAATIAGTSKKPHYGTIVTEIRRVSSAIQARQASALVKRAELRAAALAEYTKLEKPQGKLAIIATNLASLSEEKSGADQLESLQKFFKSILDGLEEKQSLEDAATEEGTGTEKQAHQ